MKVLLVEPGVKSIAPNLALLKFARWCEELGYEYEYVHGLVKPTIYPDRLYTSCIFSYNSEKYKQMFRYYRKLFPGVEIKAGGVFPTINPQWFLNQDVTPHQGLYEEIEELIPKYDVEILGKKNALYGKDRIILYSSKGCVNKCGYCVVPRLEGKMKSYKSISRILDAAGQEMPSARSIVLYDNNFTEHEYFDNIVDELKDFGKPIDVFGLHVDSFTEHHAKRLAELKWGSQSETGTPYVRFSFDKMRYANGIEKALKLVLKYKIRAQFFCYMLFNFTDSPDDFWERLQIAQQIRDRVGGTIYLFPQRYEPLDAVKRNSYISPKWTPEMLHGLVRLYTYIHGFLSITESKNLFNWIGHTRDEFFKNIIHMDTAKEISKKLPQKEKEKDGTAEM
jgi:hypothetical protein